MQGDERSVVTARADIIQKALVGRIKQIDGAKPASRRAAAAFFPEENEISRSDDIPPASTAMRIALR